MARESLLTFWHIAWTTNWKTCCRFCDIKILGRASASRLEGSRRRMISKCYTDEFTTHQWPVASKLADVNIYVSVQKGCCVFSLWRCSRITNHGMCLWLSNLMPWIRVYVLENSVHLVTNPCLSELCAVWKALCSKKGGLTTHINDFLESHKVTLL